MSKLSRYDLLSLAIIFLLSIFSFVRFDYLPQFIDGYYHLSTANAFIKSRGWVGWDWWGFAPSGRPHLYPPLYHLVLVFLIKIGISGINAIRLTEILSVPLFFFFLWYISRKLRNGIFAFCFLSILGSFFAFYVSVSANVPATFAIIFGFLSWIYLKQKRIVPAVIFLAFVFYTHAAICWIMFGAILFLGFLSKEHRRRAFLTLVISLFLALPLIYHQLKYFSYLDIKVLNEAKFINFSIFITIAGIAAFLVYFRKLDYLTVLFLGYLIASIIVFFRYPFRFFSSQGIVGLAFFAALMTEEAITFLRKNNLKIAIVGIMGFIFIFQPTIDFDNGKPSVNVLNSTLWNYLSGKIYNLFYFQSFFQPKFFNPVIKVIKNNSFDTAIVSSNLSVVSQILASLSNRPSGNSLLWEVKQKKENNYRYAKIVIWAKPLDKSAADIKGTNWSLIYENDIFYVFLNIDKTYLIYPLRSKINFLFISFICIFIFSLLWFLKNVVV